MCWRLDGLSVICVCINSECVCVVNIGELNASIHLYIWAKCVTER